MEFHFTVKPDAAEPFKVVAGTRDIVAWEKGKSTRSLALLVGDGVRLSELYVLAHCAAKRQGLYAGTVAEFEAGVDIEMGGDADEETAADEDPTQPAR